MKKIRRIFSDILTRKNRFVWVVSSIILVGAFLPKSNTNISANLYCQTLSKEYVTILRHEITTKDARKVLFNLWETHGMSKPVAMTSASTTKAAPKAEFGSNTISGTAPLTVEFMDLSTHNPERWLWDFGDGTQSNVANPVHIYDSPGIFTVSLQVSNAYGTSTNTKPDYITVKEDSSNFKKNELENIIAELSIESYPNPFTDIVHIKVFSIDEGYGNVEIYNSHGQVVERLKNQKLESGANIIIWYTSEIEAGIYYCKLNFNNETAVISLLKIQ